MGTSTDTDVWSLGDGYEPYVGRWSRIVAQDFVAWLAVPLGAHWLDVGCGTGALSATILALAEPAQVTGIDPSAGFVGYASAHTTDPRAHFEVGDALALPVDSASQDAVVAGLVLNFVPDPGAAVTEMLRATRPGGTIGAYVWNYASGMEMMSRFWAAATSLDPAARQFDQARRFGDLCQPDALTALFQDAGAHTVDVRAIDIPMRFQGFDDYWSPFLGGQGPAPAYAVSLPEERRVALRDRLHATLPTAADGSISLKAQAWAVRGRR